MTGKTGGTYYRSKEQLTVALYSTPQGNTSVYGVFVTAEEAREHFAQYGNPQDTLRISSESVISKIK